MAGWTKDAYKNGDIHTHWNMEVLNKLSQADNGKLLYDNKLICGCPDGGLAYAQTNVTGVTASAASPKVVGIAIKATTDYRTVPTWVEYFVPGKTLLETKYSFDNADAAAFDVASDPQVLFDGTMHLKTKYTDAFTVIGALAGTGQYSESVWLDRAEWKTIEKVEVA